MPLIVANWKMNPKNSVEAENLFQEVKRGTKNACSKQGQRTEVVICPPFVWLPLLSVSAFSKDFGGLRFGSQNCFWEQKGAFTGEISPLQLKNLNVKYVILGHSERRQYLGETDEMIAKKLKAVLEARLLPILCIGETKEERTAEKTAEILKTQLENALTNLPIYQLTSLIVAYEPAWAIGTGDFCSPDEALTNLMFIKKQLLKLLPQKTVDKIRILYGGSVDSKNAKDYIDVGLDGFLVGGASLKAEEFVKIVKICKM